MSSGMAFAGQHGEMSSVCGTQGHAEQRQLIGAGIIPVNSLEYHLTDEMIEALNQPQREMLLSFEQSVFDGMTAPHVCMHPDTDPKVAEAFELFLADLWFGDPNPNSFILSNRWTSTATDGAGLGLGDPTTLTYSFLADGTNISGEGGSQLINFLNTRIGSGTWEGLFQTALDAWANVSGLTYVREFNDDGTTLSGGGLPGQLGSRGDVRIGGAFLDGNSGVLAYNFFPNGGDMVIDTGDGAFFGTASNNYIRLRNVVTHEAGHGIGLAHVESDSNRFLMEPFIDTSFTGPQVDDMRGAQRGYGDADENNNTFAGASDFNLISTGSSDAFEGQDFATISNRSMDDNSDIDYLRIVTGEPVTMTLSLTPTGGSYQFTAQGGGGGGSFFDASSVADLKFTVANEITATLLTVDDNGDGQAEVGVIDLPEAGTYYIVVDGDNTNNIQLYVLSVFFATLEVETCEADLNGDGSLDFFDVSAFLIAFAANDPIADFSGDGSFDFFDVAEFLSQFGAGCP
jgi:hypothetical protein